MMEQPKLIVVILYNRGMGKYETQYVIDNRDHRLWTKEEIHERGIESFLDGKDVKETLNWNCNGDDDKYSCCETLDYLTALVYQ